MNERLHRRMIGWLRARLPDARLDQVGDPRRAHRRKWSLASMLSAVMVGLLAGCRSLAGVEAVTREMSQAARRALGIAGRIADTTLRDALVRISATDLRAALARVVRSAHRRRALEPVGLPWGAVSMDGKATSISSWDHEIAQQQGDHGVVRTITSTLVSSAARVALDAHPVPASSNEMGTYKAALTALVEKYKSIDLFRVAMYDAGACSEANARFTRTLGLHYVMVLNEAQPTLHAEARRVLGDLPRDQALCVLDDTRQNVRYSVWLTEGMQGYLDWSHLHTVLRVERDVLDEQGRARSTGERFFVTSLRPKALEPEQWVTLLRARWGVENNCHHTFDTVFHEDTSTWFSASPQGALVIILLRRIAYTLAALFRSHTLRTEATRLTPWRDLLRWTRNALITASQATVAGLRPRPAPPP